MLASCHICYWYLAILNVFFLFSRCKVGIKKFIGLADFAKQAGTREAVIETFALTMAASTEQDLA